MWMTIMLVAAVLSNAPSDAQVMPACPGISIVSSVDQFSRLPKDIQDDLLANFDHMAKGGEPLLATDAPSSAEMNYPTSRFVHAVLIKNVWYVQMEIAMTEGVRTIGYHLGSTGHLERSASQYLGGPACETLRALTNRVYNPGPPYR